MSVRGVFVHASDRRDFAVGDEIFRKGEMGEEMFGVVSGKIELRFGDEVVATVVPSGTFGEMAIVSDRVLEVSQQSPWNRRVSP